MYYTEYFTLRDCSRFLQIRSQYDWLLAGVLFLSFPIDNIPHYGYETNHVSSYISIRARSSILVSRVKNETFWFLAVRGCEGLLVQQVIYAGGFINYLLT